jgi:arylsulfatase A-like enzyme
MPERFENERDHIIAHYDAELREADEHIGRLLERMREAGLLESTIVVVTSDHGEGFGERGYMQHGPRVDDAVMRVPLIVRLPGEHPDAKPGLSVDGVVRTADILPTVLHAASVPFPRNLDGVSLLPAMRGEPLPELWAYGEAGRSFVEVDPELYLPGVAGKHRMVRSSDWKLVRVPGAEPEYRLHKLPDEEVDVSEDHPAVVADLRSYLERIQATEREPSVESPLTPEELRTLKSLGYVH